MTVAAEPKERFSAYHIVLLVLLGVATLWMAVLADTGAALLVIANGMRLLRYRE